MLSSTSSIHIENALMIFCWSFTRKRLILLMSNLSLTSTYVELVKIIINGHGSHFKYYLVSFALTFKELLFLCQLRQANKIDKLYGTISFIPPSSSSSSHSRSRRRREKIRITSIFLKERRWELLNLRKSCASPQIPLLLPLLTLLCVR